VRTSGVLVTNDDGVRAPGLLALARALIDAGWDVTVVAPLDDRSGSGAAIGPVHLENGIDFEEVAIDGLEGVATFGVDGPPALAVMLARLGAFGEPPALIASGVNPGTNTGRAVLHSGTVGAALTAANFGAKGLAVSVREADEPRYDTAAALAVDALAWLAESTTCRVLNVNVPDRARDDIAGVRVARLAPFGTVRTAVTGVENNRLQFELRETLDELEPDTDTALVRSGFVAVTALHGVTALGDASLQQLTQTLDEQPKADCA
jgi:5'/3'-nucleotidase